MSDKGERVRRQDLSQGYEFGVIVSMHVRYEIVRWSQAVADSLSAL